MKWLSETSPFYRFTYVQCINQVVIEQYLRFVLHLVSIGWYSVWEPTLVVVVCFFVVVFFLSKYAMRRLQKEIDVGY